MKHCLNFRPFVVEFAVKIQKGSLDYPLKVYGVHA